MKDRRLFLFGYELLVSAGALLASGLVLSPSRLILGMLALACLLGVRLLWELSGRAVWVCTVLALAALAVALAFGGGMLPFAGVVLLREGERLAPGRAGVALGCAATALAGVVFWPPLPTAIIAVLCMAPLAFMSFLQARLVIAREQLASRGEEVDALRARIADQRRMLGTMERAARLAERNRLAGRIHDQVGHGISGSILLLEGAMLSMDREPEQARAALLAAAGNLRAAVDGIRSALRAERADREELGIAQVGAQLSRFHAEHPGIQTELLTQGDLALLSPLVWMCIRENLSEALTNVLKHSGADRFSASIAVRKKLVHVRFRDNGKGGGFSPGMGLSAMEERCALSHGRCFFQSDERGFAIVMTFAQPKEEERGGEWK